MIWCASLALSANPCHILSLLSWMRQNVSAGPVRVTVAGVPTPTSTFYDYQTLTRPPTVDFVEPLSGAVVGGAEVGVRGSGFAGDAVVWFMERGVDLQLTGNRSECLWRSQPGMACNDTHIRCVVHLLEVGLAESNVRVRVRGP